MVERDPDSLADEVRAAGRDPVDARARLADELVPHLRHREQHDGRDARERDESERRPAPPRDGDGDDDARAASATKLDCENEMRSPSQVAATTP